MEQTNDLSPDGRVRQRDRLLAKIREAEFILDVTETHHLPELECDPKECNSYAEIVLLVTRARNHLIAAKDRACGLLVAARNAAEIPDYADLCQERVPVFAENGEQIGEGGPCQQEKPCPYHDAPYVTDPRA